MPPQQPDRLLDFVGDRLGFRFHFNLQRRIGAEMPFPGRSGAFGAFV